MSESVLMKVPIGDGSDDFIEAKVSLHEAEGLQESGVVLAAAGSDKFEATTFSLTSAIEHVVPALKMVVGRLRGGVHAPDEMTLQVGLQIGGETGFVFAKGSAEANIALTMTWHREPATSVPVTYSEAESDIPQAVSSTAGSV